MHEAKRQHLFKMLMYANKVFNTRWTRSYYRVKLCVGGKMGVLSVHTVVRRVHILQSGDKGEKVRIGRSIYLCIQNEK